LKSLTIGPASAAGQVHQITDDDKCAAAFTEMGLGRAIFPPRPLKSAARHLEEEIMNKAWKSPMRWKTLLAGAAALMLAGSCLAQAQQSPAGAKRLPWEDRAPVVDARIAVLKAGLKLTPDQEKNWPTYEAALRNLAKLRVERYQETKSANPVELLRQRAEDLSSASAALKQLADAEEPLFNSFDDAQKHRLATFARHARERRSRD